LIHQKELFRLFARVNKNALVFSAARLGAVHLRALALPVRGAVLDPAEQAEETAFAYRAERAERHSADAAVMLFHRALDLALAIAAVRRHAKKIAARRFKPAGPRRFSQVFAEGKKL
jgi:hypothetical protein